jgi:hypothetical protein
LARELRRQSSEPSLKPFLSLFGRLYKKLLEIFTGYLIIRVEIQISSEAVVFFLAEIYALALK